VGQVCRAAKRGDGNPSSDLSEATRLVEELDLSSKTLILASGAVSTTDVSGGQRP
jgi:hypothetical protein